MYFMKNYKLINIFTLLNFSSSGEYTHMREVKIEVKQRQKFTAQDFGINGKSILKPGHNYKIEDFNILKTK